MATTVAELRKEYPVLTAQIEKEAREGMEEVVPEIKITTNKDGSIAVWTEILRDRNSEQISKRVDTYKDGQIVLEKFDANNKLISSRKAITHASIRNQKTA